MIVWSFTAMFYQHQRLQLQETLWHPIKHQQERGKVNYWSTSWVETSFVRRERERLPILLQSIYIKIQYKFHRFNSLYIYRFKPIIEKPSLQAQTTDISTIWSLYSLVKLTFPTFSVLVICFSCSYQHSAKCSVKIQASRQYSSSIGIHSLC